MHERKHKEVINRTGTLAVAIFGPMQKDVIELSRIRGCTYKCGFRATCTKTYPQGTTFRAASFRNGTEERDKIVLVHDNASRTNGIF